MEVYPCGGEFGEFDLDLQSSGGATNKEPPSD
jgi:hypothetical protein